MGGGVSSAAAQTGNPLPWDNLTEPAEYVSFDVEGSDWDLFPVITSDDTFVGFFGHLPQNQVVGNNVSLLWLVPDNGDGTWSMYGWSHTELKFVSNYLDALTGTEQVLSDTGLDIFSNSSQQISQPKGMPNGIAEDDPAAPIVAATGDPAIASALVTIGAAGAPNLTQAINLQPHNDCIAFNAGPGFTELDIDLAYKSRIIQETMTVWLSDEILDSLEATGLDQDESSLRACVCWPSDRTLWGPWSAWTCTGGPRSVVGGCEYTGCTRNRTGIRTQISLFCTITVTTIPDAQGPSTFVDPPNADGSCPATHQ